MNEFQIFGISVGVFTMIWYYDVLQEVCDDGVYNLMSSRGVQGVVLGYYFFFMFL